MRALQGITVLDFSHVVAGPFAGSLLAQQGADVIKVEAAGLGDGLRGYGGDPRFAGMAPMFLSVNGGKRSIALDMRSEDGRDVARRLIARSDVVLENLRPGAMARLGLDYAAARELRADIVYCSISGFGQTGERSQRPAIDNIIQAASGFAALGNDSPGFPLIDTYTGMVAALAVTNALLRRERTGLGQHIDVAMLDSAIAMMASVAVPALAGAPLPRRADGRGGSVNPTTGSFTARDGLTIAIGASKDEQFRRLVTAGGRAELADHPDYATSAARRAHAPALLAELGAMFAERDAAQWEADFNAAGIPCAAVREFTDALSHDDLRARGAIQSVASPLAGAGAEALELTGSGYAADADGPRFDRPPPRAGQHSRDILHELDLDGDAIDRLIATGVVTVNEECQ